MRARYDGTSGVPIFANGAATAAFASIVSEATNKLQKDFGGNDKESDQLGNSNVRITTTEVVDKNGKVIKRGVAIAGTIQDKTGLGIGKTFEASVESAFSGRFIDPSDGVTYELTTNLEALGNDVQSLLKGADLTLVQGSCSGNIACAGGGIIKIQDGAYFTSHPYIVSSHEFGHILGVSHGSFLSKSGAFKPNLNSIKAIYDKYNLD